MADHPLSSPTSEASTTVDCPCLCQLSMESCQAAPPREPQRKLCEACPGKASSDALLTALNKTIGLGGRRDHEFGIIHGKLCKHCTRVRRWTDKRLQVAESFVESPKSRFRPLAAHPVGAWPAFDGAALTGS